MGAENDISLPEMGCAPFHNAGARKHPAQTERVTQGFIQVPSVQIGCLESVSSSCRQQLPTSGASIDKEPEHSLAAL